MNTYSYEVIIIGSGATGGVAAKTFAEAGINVLIVEAGPSISALKAYGSEPGNSISRVKGIISGEHRIQCQHPGYWKNNPLLYSNEKDNPYETTNNNPFIWTQGRQVGGRSLTWGGITLRLSDSEFKASDKDNYGESWPISYNDLSSHYSALERDLKVHGNKDNLEQLPDGEYKEPFPFTQAEEIFKTIISKNLNYPVINSRGFGPFRPKHENDWSPSSSLGSSLKKALETGNVKILSNHIAERIIPNIQKSLAEGLIVIDTRDGSRKKLLSKLVVVCASTIQTNRLLLNSEENSSEKGFIEPSGTLGKYLMDHISLCRFFTIKCNGRNKNKDSLKKSDELSGAGSIFIPFGNKFYDENKVDFIRGYGIWGGIDRFNLPEWIKGLNNSSIGFLIGHGEVLASDKNKMTLSNKKDKWGIPLPLIDFSWGDNEKRMVKHMEKRINQIIRVCDGEIINMNKFIEMPVIKNFLRNAVALQDQAPPPGYYIHEVGGARMGANEETSVVDKWNRLWRCQNVLIVDGSCWPSSGWQSPTLTMMAITRRACLKAINSRQG